MLKTIDSLTIPLSNHAILKATSGYSNSMHPGNNSTDASTDLKGADNLVGEVYNTLISNHGYGKNITCDHV